MRKGTVFLWLLLLSVWGWAQEDAAKYPVRETRLTDHLDMWQCAGGNMACYHDGDFNLLVDTDYEQTSPQVLDAVKKAGGPGWVINTHWHFDHVGGNAALKKAGALILAHQQVRDRMIEGGKLAVIDRELPPAPAETLPDITFTREMTLVAAHDTIHLRHLPGHTGGDSVVIFDEANVIHAGDLFFNGGYPFIDINHGGSINKLIDSVEKVLSWCDEETRIIPGHGPLASKADLASYLDMLKAFRKAIREARDAGRDLASIQENSPTADLDAKYGKVMFPPEAFAHLVFETLDR